MTEPVILAWAAGLFEGEGCIYVEKRTYRSVCAGVPRASLHYRLHIDLANTDIALVDAFKKYFGGRIDMNTSGRHRPCFHWSLCSNKAAQFLSLLLPFMVGSKRRQAEIAIDFADRYSAQGLQLRSRNKTPEEKADQHRIYIELQVLKRAQSASVGTA